MTPINKSFQDYMYKALQQWRNTMEGNRNKPIMHMAYPIHKRTHCEKTIAHLRLWNLHFKSFYFFQLIDKKNSASLTAQNLEKRIPSFIDRTSIECGALRNMKGLPVLSRSGAENHSEGLVYKTINVLVQSCKQMFEDANHACLDRLKWCWLEMG
jgi:hypothetical protein